ncbi:MAG: TonB-dependent receptor [Raineya sp.]|nr:TonB-dependent receptor [Raineya sp.]
MKPICIFLLCAFIANVGWLKAQTDSTQIKLFSSSVDEILRLKKDEESEVQVVTASRVKENLSDAPASITVITREDIERYGYRNLAELLARVPEVYTHYTGNNFDTDFRGFFTNNTRRNVLFLINGHRINERFHFGDFYADIIGDLNNVERVEILRGPGGALYGSVAVQGVVNIITRNADPVFLSRENRVKLYTSAIFEELGRNSIVQRYSMGVTFGITEKSNLSLTLYRFSGGLEYNTKTGDKPLPWQSSFTKKGAGLADIIYRNQIYWDVPNDGSFSGGYDFPNFDVRFNSEYFAVGAFMHSRAVSWVQPKDNVTFNHPDNDRQWSHGAAYLELKPITKWNITARISYNLSTNREIQDFSLTDRNPINGQTLAMNALNTILNPFTGANANRFLLIDGNFVRYNTLIDASLLKDSTLAYNGGGLRINYAGVTKSWGGEFQMIPFKNEKINVGLGGNIEIADYKNIQWITARNNKFLFYRPSGGISDNGWYYGLWLQAIYTPIPKLTITAGVRYDYQFIKDAYRNFGNQVVYTFNANTGEYTPIRAQNKVDQNITPRAVINYRFNENTNVRAIFARAFRAVPPQEVIRLPLDIEPKSEITDNYEIIVSHNFNKKRSNVSFNTFYLQNNRLYQFNPALQAFNAGSAWSNIGFTLSTYHRLEYVDFWGSATYYILRRPSDAFAFMRDYKKPREGTGILGTIGSGGVAPIYDPLPNMLLPLDSPDLLIKGGGSYSFKRGTTIGMESYFNGQILMLAPANNNAGELRPEAIIVQGNQVIENPNPNPNNYTKHYVPASLYFNLYIRQNFDRLLNVRGLFIELKVNNLLNSPVWNVLNSDAQGWNSAIYYKPNQIPDFGRRFMFSFNYIIQ